MKVKPTLLKPITAIILSIAILNLQSCSIVKLEKKDKEMYLGTEADIPDDKTLYVYSGGRLYQVSSFEISEEGVFSGTYVNPPPGLNNEVIELIEKDGNYITNDAKMVKDAIILQLPENTINGDLDQITFALSDVSSLSTIDPATGKIILLVVVGVVTVAALIIMLVALLKSSCPFIYTYDADRNVTFNGEVFGGAIFKPIERRDFMPLSGLEVNAEGKLQIVLSNELKETQYINELELWATEVLNDEEILWQINGAPVAITSEWKADKAQDDNFKDASALIEKSDEMQFSFTETRGHLFENLNLNFENISENEGLYLKMDLKNSLWLDQLWFNFTKHFGTYYDEWAANQNTVPMEEMQQWNRDQGINLEVFVKRNGEWELFHTLECIGPLAFRKIVVPMPPPEDGKLEIRLQSGLMFWDINQVSLVKGEVRNPVSIPISEALSNKNGDARNLIDEADEKYLIQENVGDSLYLNFHHNTESNYSYCLQAQGYYLHQRDFTNKPDKLKLLSFKDKRAFVKYSQELLHKYKLHLQHEGT